ncbi:MAG: PQQ-dependent sugar dehydrogenase [Burkholderiaceae bacterium]|nr:PQQ-dependent sugar dehydrogenase [Burkholderiaceae bacterium]
MRYRLNTLITALSLLCGLMLPTAGHADSVPQTGRQANAILAALQHITLPPGFKIQLYAMVPGARQLAVAPTGGLVFVGTRGSNLWAVTNTTQHDLANQVFRYAPTLNFDLPNGVCFAKDGTLYSVEFNRIRAFPKAQSDYKNKEVSSTLLMEPLVPATVSSRNHGARVCRVGSDQKLYIALGQPYNVPPKDKLTSYRKTGMMGIIRMDLDGTHREVYATGIRNSVGMDFNPADGTLWFTDNQVDLMGDDIPPGEINHVTQIGQDFGFPYYGGGHVRTLEYQADKLPAGLVAPEVEMDAHAADLGMTFYDASQFPKKYQGGIFSAQHGSWNRSTPIGARIMFTAVKSDGTAGATEIFAQGWLRADHSYSGRPVDVAVLPDGSLLVSDDQAGALYRIFYESP